MRHTRFAAAGAIALVGGLVLSGCAASGDDSNDQITLTFWGTYGNGGNSAQTDVLENELIPAFEKENPGIQVEYVDMPYDGLKQKLTTSAAGGELPDLIRSDIGWVAQFAELGVFKQLDGTMSGFEELADAVYPGTLETTSWNGHYYGIPLNTNTRVLVTNSAALEAAGLSAPPATFDEMKQLAAGLSGTDTYAFADSGLSAWNVMPWIWSAGGDIADADLSTSTGYLNSPESVAGIQLLVDLYKEGQVPNLITGNSGATGTSDGLPSGQYASILDGPWMQDIWAGQYPDFEPVYSAVPAGSGGSISVVGGESLVVTESTAHAEAAYKFLEFSQSETYQLGMAKAGQMSVKPEFAQKQADLVPYFATFADQLETARARLPIPQAGEVDTILNDELVPAFEGDVTVEDALTAAAAKIDELLAADN
ncbi:maltose-binding protein [Microbacterium aurum]|uniref:Maltose-binding protein n=1 Tax=Microbacterium aurum TaxID=36805 RepID=A0A1P8U5J9_9MICO|nr:extracellular solute-binding protein [Microbacterium aurum]APZ33380.1 maltose-binding protein [Microbacterium aurum]MBM7827030.1 multiple sugar transport system substrate-binding protein [Microbacterium aurum]